MRIRAGGCRTRWRSPWLFAVVFAQAVAAQAPRPTPPRFEAASVKPSVPGTNGGRVQFLQGRFVGENVPLDYLLQQLYGVRDFQIVASPEVKAIIRDGRESRYEFQARAGDDTPPEQVKEMVKTLLADRFHLQLHRETRVLPAYTLVPAKGGVRGLISGEQRQGVEFVANGWLRGQATTARLAEYLSRFVDRPILDRTAVTGVIEFNLGFTPIVNPGTPDSVSGCPSGFREMASRPGYTMPECPTIFNALQEQVGLSLERQDAPIEVIVIDSAERPTPD